MELRLFANGQDLEPTLRTLVEQHFWFAVHRFQPRLERVHIRFSQGPASSGIPEKRCRAELQLFNGETISLEDHDTRTEAVVNRLADRIFRTLNRKFTTGRPRRVASA